MFGTLATNSIADSSTIKVNIGDTTSTTTPTEGTAKEVVKSSQNSVKPFLSLEQIKVRIADVSQQYGLDYDQLYSVLQCESKLKPKYGDGGLAFGVAQFHKPTFDQYCKGNYYSTTDQLTCMARMFKIGQAKQWSCFKKLYTDVIYHNYTYAGDNQLPLLALMNK